MDWDKLRVFHAVAEAGSFTHAGDTLNLSQSAVSRQVSALEDSLRISLFHRHARGLILTEQGELLYRTVKDVFHKLSMAEALISESRDRPSGPLKITTTVAFGTTWLTPRIKEFVELFPDVEVSLILSDGSLDLSMREADVAIRMAKPKQPDLVQRLLMTVQSHVYAAPEYLSNHGTPGSAEDLDQHAIILYGHDAPPPVASINWLSDVGADPEHRRKPVLRLNNLYGIYRAIHSGLGIAALPDYMITESSNLVRVLPELSGPSIEAYFVYPEELRQSKRVSVFRDFLLRKVAEGNF
ncbi:MAG: LysR family transcriptional regulator [Alphaproteobacteria bacterium]|jgi:DNA-binding transcriptional LysR family regulator|nr:LysR family transcriptional regulator [Alphaproteobacteria bacterium]